MRLYLSVVAMGMAVHLATSYIIVRSDAEADENVKKATRFVGLAYNLLKADPDAAGGGGVDPGFRTARRVVVLDSSNYEGFPRHSCVSETKTSTIFDEKSFQEKFDMDVSTEVGVSTAVAEAKFSLSTSFKEAKAKTTKSKMMTLESQTLCNLGKARLKTELNAYTISQSFQAAVCQLPGTYDKDIYVRFIDDWGTNYVSEAEVGVRNLTQKSETFTSVFQSLQNSFSLSHSVSGSYLAAVATVSGSVEMNMNTLSNSEQLRESFNGRETVKMIGTPASPEPISVVLDSIEKLVSRAAFGSNNPSVCSTAALASLPTKQANLARALKEYPAAKGAVVSPSDGKARFILNWPKGTYGLAQPTSGCPSGWASGTRKYDCEDGNPKSAASSGNHFAATIQDGDIYMKYCVKTVPTTDTNTDMDWPKGEYCIYKFRACPPGFSEGSIYHDDEDWRNKNAVDGTIPDGDYGTNTRIYFCCRSDGANTVPIFLPNTRPFYLLQAKSYGCQKVNGMNVVSENIFWDNQDGWFMNPNTNSHSGVIPYSRNDRNWRVYYCYYYP